MIHFSGVDEIIGFPPAEIDAIELAAVKREAGDGQGLALSARLLDPIVRAACGISAIPHFGDDTFEPRLAGVLVHLAAINLKALTELDIGLSDDRLEQRL